MALNRICVILLNWNGKKDTLECLDSLSKVDYRAFQTIVVDNGSTDDSVATIRAAYPNIPILETGANLGFAGGNNVGIEFALSKSYDWILLLNNDTIVAPNFLNAFIDASKEKPTGKIFGAKLYLYDKPETIDHVGGMWDASRAHFISLLVGDEMARVDYVCGAALFSHRSVFEEISLLEPRFFLFWEESDWCRRATRHGYEIWTAPKAKIWHKVSSSFTGGKPQMCYFWWRNRLFWIERNCTPQERRDLYRRILFPEIRKLVRLFLLRLFQRLLLHPSPHLLSYRGSLAGIRDYYLRRFGNPYARK